MRVACVSPPSPLVRLFSSLSFSPQSLRVCAHLSVHICPSDFADRPICCHTTLLSNADSPAAKLGTFGLTRTADNKNKMLGDDACFYDCGTFEESNGRFLARKRARSIERASADEDEVRSCNPYSIARTRHFAFSQILSNTTGIGNLTLDKIDKEKDGVQVFNFAKVVRMSKATKKDETSLFFWCANNKTNNNS